MKVKVKKVNAFTKALDGGNPAGVVFNSPKLNPEQMSKVTREMGVSETAFFFKSNLADYKVLFYTPTIEVELCGHATIASYYTLGLEGIITKDTTITQETKAGILPVDLHFKNNKIQKVMMTQTKPILKDIHLDISIIADSLGVKKNELDTSLPSQLTFSGLFTLPICVESFEILKSLKPNFKKIGNICKKINAGSFFVFTFDTIEPSSTIHARCFCPLYGVNEDPTTGTANGAVGYYLVKNKLVSKTSLYNEQGDIVGRPGRVEVEVDKDKNIVKVGGKAKIIKEKEIEV